MTQPTVLRAAPKRSSRAARLHAAGAALAFHSVLLLNRVATAFMFALPFYSFVDAAEPAAKPVVAPIAPAAPVTAAATAAFAERFKALNPGTRIDSIAPSPVAGLFEVVMGKNVAYVDDSGRYALFGHVWDMQARRDLTADRLAMVDRIDVASLPTELALRHVRGRGTRKLYVFSDPQCGFCKQLEPSLQQLDDVTIYTFVLPVLGPESKRVSTAVACAADPAAAWSAWMLKGDAPPSPAAACDRSAAAVEKLAQSLGVSGTPTLFSGDGRRNAGYMPIAQLAAWLAQTPANVAGTPGSSVADATAAAATPAAQATTPKRVAR